MTHEREYKFAEVVLSRQLLENLPAEQSAYFSPYSETKDESLLRKCISKLRWHIRHSLSQRQKEVISLILQGKTERDIARVLGVTQQVVHIYKWRAIKKLRKKLAP